MKTTMLFDPPPGDPFMRQLQTKTHTQCYSISGSLARCMRVRSPTARQRFPIISVDTPRETFDLIYVVGTARSATVATSRSWRASGLCGHPEPGLKA